MRDDYIAVVGGANMDVGGRARAPLIARDSNPGTVRMSPGGVGRNIAQDLAQLGCGVELLTVWGDDLYARQLASACAQAGVGISHALAVPGGRTPTYLFLAGPDGDMALAVNDMELCERLSPAYLAAQREVLQGARLVVLDANLPAGSIRWLCEEIAVPLFADPVSAAKAGKLKPVLGALHTLKPNRLEAELLSGVPITDRGSLERAARTLLDTGLKRVFLSLGERGVYAADSGGGELLPALPARVVNATGAGDAFTAALAWACLQGTDLPTAARLAQAAAAITAESAETIAPELTVQAVHERMFHVKHSGGRS